MLKISRCWLMAALILFVSSGLASAQMTEDEKDDLRDSIMKKVEKRLKKEEKRILKRIKKILAEELGGEKESGDESTEKTPSAPKKSKGAKKSDRPGFLGVEIADVDESAMELYQIDGGVQITNVRPDTAAEDAGIEVDDIIIAVDGEDVFDRQALIAAISGSTEGTTHKLTLIRDGDEIKLKVTLGARPEQPGMAPGGDSGEDGYEEDEPAPKKKVGPRSKKTPSDLRERIRRFMKKRGKRGDSDKSNESDDRGETQPEGSGGGDSYDEDDDSGRSDSDNPFLRQLREQLGDQGSEMEELFRGFLKSPQGKQLQDMLRGFGGEDFMRQLREQGGQMFGNPGDRSEEEDDDDYEEAPSPRKRPSSQQGRNSNPVWFGVELDEISEQLQNHLALDEGGLVVMDISEGSPADEAGIKKNDIITQINGEAATFDTLDEIFENAKAGDKLKITLMRKSRTRNLEVILAERDGD